MRFKNGIIQLNEYKQLYCIVNKIILKGRRKMNKLKDLGLLVLQVEVVGFLFIAMNKYLTNTTSFLPEAFTQDKTDIKAYGLAALAFMILGIAQYYVVDLYDKINWKKASVIEYLVEVAGVLLVFIYLQFIDNLVKFAFLFVLVSFLFIMRYLYFYKKFA